jgi:glucosamine--fructose-6-phosphate aminotransferase (isomerizing)
MSDGNPTPGAFDGMAAFALPNGNVHLIRNHENRDGPDTAKVKSDASKAYDRKAGGGTTSLEEGALKLKEISYIHAEGYPAAEMKHGPIALIDENMPVVFIAPKDAVHSKIVSNIEEVKARGGKVLALINQGDTEIERLADATFTIPVTLDLLTPMLTSIPLQLLCYYVAVAQGCNVDQPRNLAKSVTVE